MDTTTYSTARPADADAIEVLHQIAAVDGWAETVLADRAAINGSGRPCGWVYEVSAETAEYIAESLRVLAEQLEDAR